VTRAVTITVELEPGEPVSGWFECPSEPRTHFSGLLELVALVDRVRPHGDAVPPEKPERA
jgi:hypothetical protein